MLMNQMAMDYTMYQGTYGSGAVTGFHQDIMLRPAMTSRIMPIQREDDQCEADLFFAIVLTVIGIALLHEAQIHLTVRQAIAASGLQRTYNALESCVTLHRSCPMIKTRFVLQKIIPSV